MNASPYLLGVGTLPPEQYAAVIDRINGVDAFKPAIAQAIMSADAALALPGQTTALMTMVGSLKPGQYILLLQEAFIPKPAPLFILRAGSLDDVRNIQKSSPGTYAVLGPAVPLTDPFPWGWVLGGVGAVAAGVVGYLVMRKNEKA